MNEALYHERILALAKAAHGAGRLTAPDGRAVADNPLCGDRIAVELEVDGERRITAVAHEVRGCLLCQAAASLLGTIAVGLDAEGLATAHAGLRALLTMPEPPAVSEDDAAFLPVRRHKARHGCVLLAFEAAERALAQALGR